MPQFNFEPPVIRSIKRYRRGTFLQSALAFLPLCIGIVVYVVLIIHFAGENWRKARPEVFWFIQFAIGVGIVLYFGFALLRLSDRSRFEKLYSAGLIKNPDASRYNEFANSLDNVRIGAGHEPVPIAVMRTGNLFVLIHMDSEGVSFTTGLAKANRITPTYPFVEMRVFQTKRHQLSVVISEDIFKAPLSQQEVEALMANALGHATIGDISNPPGYVTIRVLFIATAYLFCGLSFQAVWVANEVMKKGSVVVGVLTGIALAILLIGLGVFTVFYTGRSVRRRCEQEILADSLAIKLTEDPAALRDAVMQTYKLNCDFFKTPYKFIGEKTPRLYKTYIDSFRELTNERVQNIDAIDSGHWPLFDRFDRSK